MDHSLGAVVRRLRTSEDSEEPDANLLRRFSEHRDGDAFSELIRRHGPAVWGVCCRNLPDPTAAEDVFQTTFLVLARKPTAPQGSLGGWLYGVAIRAAAQTRRLAARRQRRETIAFRNTSLPTDSPETGWADEELARLPARYRDAIVLCHIEGLTVAEAGKQLQCSANTIKTRLVRGRDLLRRRLERRGILASALGVGIGVPPALLAKTLAAAETGTVPPELLELVLALSHRGMAMRRNLLLFALALATCGLGAWVTVGAGIEQTAGNRPGNAGSPPAGTSGEKLTVDEAKKLVTLAASSPTKELQDMSQTGKLPDNRTLTVFLFTVVPGKPEGSEKDLKFLQDPVNPAHLAEAITGRWGKLTGYGTVIWPEYITDCTCDSTDKSATGTISFRSKVYEGNLRYRAEKVDGKWAVTSFELPNFQVRLVRGKDGTWSEEPLPRPKK